MRGMIICPHCKKDLPETAIRCRYCRRPIKKNIRSGFLFPSKSNILSRLGVLLADENTPSLGWLSVAVFLALYVAGTWAIQDQGIVSECLNWLRGHFFAFTQEPLLQTYVHIFIETFILKLGIVLCLIVFLASSGKPVAATLGLTNRLQNYSKYFLYGFLCLTVGVAWFEGLDPLTPDLPTPLFFQDSAKIGNILYMVSIVLVAPITEEIIFRGFFYPAFFSSVGRMGSIFVTAILFAAVHGAQLHWSMDHLSIIFVVGFLLTLARAMTGSTLYTIGLHAVYNFALMAAGFIRYQWYGY